MKTEGFFLVVRTTRRVSADMLVYKKMGNLLQTKWEETAKVSTKTPCSHDWSCGNIWAEGRIKNHLRTQGTKTDHFHCHLSVYTIPITQETGLLRQLGTNSGDVNILPNDVSSAVGPNYTVRHVVGHVHACYCCLFGWEAGMVSAISSKHAISKTVWRAAGTHQILSFMPRSHFLVGGNGGSCLSRWKALPQGRTTGGYSSARMNFCFRLGLAVITWPIGNLTYCWHIIAETSQLESICINYIVLEGAESSGRDK